MNGTGRECVDCVPTAPSPFTIVIIVERRSRETRPGRRAFAVRGVIMFIASCMNMASMVTIKSAIHWSLLWAKPFFSRAIMRGCASCKMRQSKFRALLN